MTPTALRWSAWIVGSLAVFASSPAAARDLFVPVQYATIQAAVDAARSGDQILIDGGSFDESVLVRNKSLTFRGRFRLNRPTILSVTAINATGLRFDNVGLGGNGPVYAQTALSTTRTDITIENGIARGRLEIANTNSVTIRNTTVERPSIGEGLILTNVNQAVLVTSTFTGGDGFGGQCFEGLIVRPVAGRAAINAVNVRDLRIDRCSLNGGKGGVLLPSDVPCSFALPLSAGGGPALLATQSVVRTSGSAFTPGIGTPRGQPFALNGSTVTEGFLPVAGNGILFR